jgi:TRAP-type transport system periplasmic protein
MTRNRRLSRKLLFGILGGLGVSTSRLLAVKPASAEVYTFRMGVTKPVTSAAGIAALRFASAVNRRSNGQLKIDVYPNGQLANDQATVDGLMTGVVDLAMHATSFLTPFIPQYQVFDLPFLFKDSATTYRVVDGPIGEEFFAPLESKGIVGLSWGVGSFKELETTSNTVSAPADVKGLRIRILNSAVYVATYQSLGAIPIVIDPAEAMLALSQHTIDGADFSLDVFNSGQFYSVLKHIAMTNHFLSLTPLIGNKRKIDALPAALRTVLKEEVKNVVPFWRSLTNRQNSDAVQTLKANGVTFTEVQYPAFRKAVEPVYALAQSRIGAAVIERIVRAAANTR